MPASIGCRRHAGPAARRVMLSLLAVCMAGGCSLTGDIRRTPQPRPSTDRPPGQTVGRPASWLVETGPGMVEVRSAPVDVPADHHRRTVEFADGTRGAALFLRCAPTAAGGATAGGAASAAPTASRGAAPDGCSAVLATTGDGGRSWQRRTHPRPLATAHELHLRPDGTLLVHALPYGWYSSPDLGATFQPVPGGDRVAPEALGVTGPFTVCCAAGPQRLVRWVDGSRQELAAPPPLPGAPLSVAYRPGRDLWAASVQGGRPYTAVSTDEGRSWQPAAVPAPTVRLAGLVVRASADGGDLWLTGTAAGGRPVAFWRLDGPGWQRLPAGRSPAAVAGVPARLTAAAPAGSGLLALTGDAGAGLLGERYTPTDWPLVGPVDQLPDGTLLAVDDGAGVVWLGRGEGAVRRWALLEFRQE